MNILLITPSYKPAYVYGGPTFSISKLAEQLSIYHKIDLVTTTANGKQELDVEVNKPILIENVNVIYFKRQTKDHSHFSLNLFQYVWRNCKRYDIVHIHSWWNLVSIISSLICILRGSKVLITPRGMLSEYTLKNSVFKKVVNKLFSTSIYKKFFWHLTSNYEIQQLKYVKPEHKYLVPNFILDETYVDVEFENKKDLLFLSRIERKKNIELLLNSIPNLNSKINLNIVGNIEPNYLNKLKKNVKNNEIENQVFWHKPAYGTNKNNILAKACLLVLPSYDENFANVVLESLLNGTGVIVSENVGLADFVKKFDLGWVLNSNGDLPELINEALSNIDKQKYIYSNARNIVLQEFDDKKTIKEYLNMYDSILKK